jgi:hypothetical protein
VNREEILNADRRFAIPIAIITIFAVGLFVLARFLLADATDADNDAELLREIDKNQAQFMASYVVQAVSVALLALPLTYLFRAASRRSDNVNRALLGAVIAGPVFLGIFFIIDGIVGMNAASDFVGMDFGPNDDIEEIAEDAKPEQDLSSLAAGFSIAGALGLAAGMGYTCLQSLRIGLLSRFWGSLGIALGVTAIFLFPFTMMWFVYLGLLISGRVPGGRPPAWAAAKPVPWPSPGERMAEQMAPRGPVEDDDEDVVDATGEPANPPRQRGERRKRKRRT